MPEDEEEEDPYPVLEGEVVGIMLPPQVCCQPKVRNLTETGKVYAWHHLEPVRI